MGDLSFHQTFHASANGVELVEAANYADMRDLIGVADGKPYGLNLLRAYAANADTTVTIPTYDGSGQVVHPDVVFIPNGWNGYRYWMAFTPFPAGNQAYENPSIVASNDGTTWVVPAGLTNPIVAAPGVGWNADASLLLAPSGRMYCYHLWTNVDVTKIYETHSDDGTTWSAHTELLSSATTGENMLSPTVVYKDGVYYMWTVDTLATPTVVRRSCSTPDGTFANAADCTTTMAGGVTPFHVDVLRTGSEYLMILHTQGTANQIRLATSHDGLVWDVQTVPLLAARVADASKWDSAIVYRSTGVLAENGQHLKLWYSGANATPVWGVGYADVDLDFDAVSSDGVLATALKLWNRAGAINTGVGVLFQTSTVDGQYGAFIGAQNTAGTGSYQNPAIVFCTMYNTSGIATLVERMRLTPAGHLQIGPTIATDDLTVSSETGTNPFVKVVHTNYTSAFVKVGVVKPESIGYAGIWFNQATPTVENYTILVDGNGATIFNTTAGQGFSFRVGNTNKTIVAATGEIWVISNTVGLKLDASGTTTIISDGTMVTINKPVLVSGSVRFPENTATINTTPSPNTCTANLTAGNHWTIPANTADDAITATITVPSSPCAGVFFIPQGVTPRDITWIPSAGTAAWVGTEPDWTDASEASEIHLASWAWNGTYLFLSDAGKTSITP